MAKLTLGSLFRGAGSVAIGTAAGHGIVLLVTPWLARHYSPSDFGSLALLLTVTNIATALACFRYDLALPSVKDREQTVTFQLAAIAATLSAVLVVLALFFSPYVDSDFSWGPPFNSTLLLGLCIACAGIQQAFIGSLTYSRKYFAIGSIRFSQGAAFAVFVFIPGIGLVLAHILSLVISLPYALKQLSSEKFSPKRVRRTAYKYRDFPLLGLPGAMLDVIGYSACLWIVVYFFGREDAGQYSQIQRILGAPLMLLGISLGQVLLRVSVDCKETEGYLDLLFKRLSVLGAIFGLSLLVVVSIFGEPLLHWMLGSQWRVDILFILPIALAVTIRACVSPLSVMLIAIRRFDVALHWQTIYFLSSIFILTLAAMNLSFDRFVLVYGAHEFILYLLYLKFISNAIRNVRCVASLV